MIRIDEQISEMAVNLLKTYRLSHGLLIPDSLIAATALVTDSRFVTKNQKDYRFIDGLKLLPYPVEYGWLTCSTISSGKIQTPSE